MASKITYDKLGGKEIDRLNKTLEQLQKELQLVEKDAKEMGSVSSSNLKKMDSLMRKLSVTEQKKITTDKELLAAQKKLASAQQKRINKSIKLKQQERELQRSAKLQVKSLNDLNRQTNALIKIRARLDTTTAKGRKQFDQLTKSINKNTIAQKRYDSQIGRSQRNVGNYTKGLLAMKVGLVAGAAVILGVARKLKNMTVAYDKQQKAEKSLQVALGGTSKKLLKQASALQKVTRIGDEVTIQGQAYLAQMGLQEDQIFKLTPLVLDFAEAQGMNTADAFKLVAKTMGSSSNSLSRYGIDVKGAVGSQERLESVTDSLSKAFKGQATAAANAGTGPLTQLGNLWGDLQETIGGLIAKGLIPAAKWMSNLVIKVNDFIKEPLSDTIKKERREVNRLTSILRTNTSSQGDKIKAYRILKKIAPDVVKGIDSEKISIGKLNKNLRSYNNLAAKRIAIASLSEEEIKAMNKKAKTTGKIGSQFIENGSKNVAFFQAEIEKSRKESITALRLYPELASAIETYQRKIYDFDPTSMTLKNTKKRASAIKKQGNELIKLISFVKEKVAGKAGLGIDSGGLISGVNSINVQFDLMNRLFSKLEERSTSVVDVHKRLIALKKKFKISEKDDTIVIEKNNEVTKKNVGLINILNETISNLNEKMSAAPDIASIEKYRKEIEKAQKKLDDLLNPPQKTNHDPIPTKLFGVGNTNVKDAKILPSSTSATKEKTSFFDSLTDKDKERIKEDANIIKNSAIDIAKSITAAKEEEIQKRIDLNNKEIDSLESSISKQKELAKQGKANNLNVLQSNLSREKALREKNIKEQAKIQKQQSRIDSIAEAGALTVSAANILKGFSTLPLVGQVLGIAAVASMFASFVAQKALMRKEANKGFAEGTENLSLNGNPKGTDTINATVNGSSIMLDEGERIISKKENKSLLKMKVKNKDIPGLVAKGLELQNMMSLNHRMGEPLKNIEFIMLENLQRQTMNEIVTFREYFKNNNIKYFIDKDGNTIKQIGDNKIQKFIN